MGKDEEERGMKIRRIVLIEFYLAFEIIFGIVEGVDLVHPKGFLVKGVKSQGKPYK
jgi:hypothetical protein